MVSGRLRPRGKPCRHLVWVFVLVCISGSTSWASRRQDMILGRWKWTDERPGDIVTARLTPGQSFSRLEFGHQGKVVGFQYFAHAFEKGGEALESGYGRYRFDGRDLVISAPKRLDSTGWPNRDGIYHAVYRCQFTENSNSEAFELAGCPLSGTWIRDQDVPR